MPEAVIVSAARSPIGRANKGSLKDFRPDDLAALIVRTALDKVPALDPHHSRRPATSAAACPAASRGNNMAPRRQRAQRHGRPSPAPPSPATAPRRCRPPGWRSTRSRPARATSSSPPASRPSRASPRAPPTTGPTPTTRSSPTPRRAPTKTAEGGRATGTTRARTACSPTPTSRWARPPRTSPRLRGLARQELDEFGVRSQNLAEKAINDGFWAREITPVTTPDGTVVSRRRRPPRRRDLRGGLASSSRSSAPTASSPPATAARSTTAPPRS